MFHQVLTASSTQFNKLGLSFDFISILERMILKLWTFVSHELINNILILNTNGKQIATNSMAFMKHLSKALYKFNSSEIFFNVQLLSSLPVQCKLI